MRPLRFQKRSCFKYYFNCEYEFWRCFLLIKLKHDVFIPNCKMLNNVTQTTSTIMIIQPEIQIRIVLNNDVLFLPGNMPSFTIPLSNVLSHTCGQRCWSCKQGTLLVPVYWYMWFHQSNKLRQRTFVITTRKLKLVRLTFSFITVINLQKSGMHTSNTKKNHVSSEVAYSFVT